MTEELVEPGPVQGQSTEERVLSEMAYEAVQHFSRNDTRGQQAQDFRPGVSDLGFCSERTRRMLAQIEPDHTDLLSAFTGTALGDYMEQAYKARFPSAIIQAEVSVPLAGETRTYHLTGHPDIIDPSGILIDVKTSRGLNVVRRTGPSQQQQFQRHCYALGAYKAGLFDPDVTLAKVRVANVWMDRACDEKEFHTHMEPFSMGVVEEAAMWLDEVVYAFEHQQEARKEPPREMCAVTCGFYATCRNLDTDVEGLITDDTILAAVEMHREGGALEKQAKQLKDQAKAHLDGVTGSTGEFTVRWVWVNGSHVEFDRNGYQRLDVRRIK